MSDALTPREAARILNVDIKTVGRWAAAGQLTELRTQGGHHRYDDTEVRIAAARMQTPGDAWLTPGEAMELLAVTRYQLRTLVAARSLVITRTLGGHARYSRESVESLAQQRSP